MRKCNLETKLYRTFGSWTYFNLIEPMKRRLEKLLIDFVWCLPHCVVYWAGMRLWVSATSGPFRKENISKTTAGKALSRWGNRQGGDRSFDPA